MPTTIIKKGEVIPADGIHVYIGRGSLFGNQFTHLDLSHLSWTTRRDAIKVHTREESIFRYADWLVNSDDPRALMILEEIAGGNLNDKILVCFCKPLSCHGDVLAHIINGTKTIEQWREYIEQQRHLYESKED